VQLAVAIVVVLLNAGFAFWQETAAVLPVLEHRVVRPGVLAPRGRP
jgi:hypothetical protein